MTKNVNRREQSQKTLCDIILRILGIEQLHTFGLVLFLFEVQSVLAACQDLWQDRLKEWSVKQDERMQKARFRHSS